MKLSARLRPLLGRVIRAGLSSLRFIKVNSDLTRNVAFQVIGLRLTWGQDEANVTRGMIVEHHINNIRVVFFILNENDHLQQHHVLGRWFEMDELRAIGEHYRGGTFVDIGSNVGNHTLYAGLVMNASRIIAFEPNPYAYKACQFNILLNSLSDRAEVHNCGLSDKTESAAVLWSGERNLGATRMTAGESGGSTLRLFRGDDLIKADEAVGFIKIDVESFELKVLSGLKGTILKNRPGMFVEVDLENAKGFDRFLKESRYTVVGEFHTASNLNFLILPAEQA